MVPREMLCEILQHHSVLQEYQMLQFYIRLCFVCGTKTACPMWEKVLHDQRLIVAISISLVCGRCIGSLNTKHHQRLENWHIIPSMGGHYIRMSDGRHHRFLLHLDLRGERSNPPRP